MRIMAATLIFVASLGFAHADLLPWPRTDYQGEFAVPGPGERNVTVSLRYQAKTRRAAVKGDVRGFGIRGVLDVESRKMRVLTEIMPERIVEVGLPKGKLKTEGTPTGETREVEGEACTVWDVDGSKVCFTEDGIWRQIEREGVTIVLTKVRREPQPDSVFDVGEATAEKLPSLLQKIKLDGLNPFPF